MFTSLWEELGSFKIQTHEFDTSSSYFPILEQDPAEARRICIAKGWIPIILRGGTTGLCQPGDVLDTYADIDDLVEEFGYKPSMSVKQGVENFVAWYKEYNKL